MSSNCSDWIVEPALPALREAAGACDLSGDVVGLAQERRLEMHEGEPRMGACKPWILRDGATEQARRQGVVAAIEAVQMLQAEVIGRPGIQVLRACEPGPLCFVQRDADFQRGENLRADLGAHGVHVVDPAGIPFGPDHPAGAGIRQFGGDHELCARNFNRSSKAVLHVEQAADLANVRIR